MSKRWHLLAWPPLLALLAWIGHGLLFTSFMLYDDEGYIQLSLRNFSAHGGLYDKVYSQYGPFFYAALDTLSGLFRFEWNTSSARWFTLFNWLGAALVCGRIVWRVTRSSLAAAYACVGVFTLLWIMLQEPGHPGGLITLLVALAAWLGAELILAGRTTALACLLGATGALVALVKINVGAFLVLASGFWLLTGMRPARGGGALRLLACLFAGALPPILMLPLMDRHWVPTYALVTACGGVAAVLCASLDGERRARPLDLLAFIGAGLATTALVAVWSMARGSSLDGLLHGVFLDPLRHPGIYSFPVKWRPLVGPVAVAGLGLVAAWMRAPDSRLLRRVVCGVRLIAALGLTICLLPKIGTSQAALALCYGVPLAAVFALPLLPGENLGETRVRAWLALLLPLQALQAYPIAGSQLNWGTFLWVPLMTLGLVDAARFLRREAPTIFPAARAWPGLVLGVWACGAALLQIDALSRVTRERLADSVPLGLPGAERVMLPPAIASGLHITSVNARANADMLFSLPGAFSFNQWTTLPTPGLKNVTHWFSLLSESEQENIIAALRADARPAFVLQRLQLRNLAENGFSARGPLVAYLHSDYLEALRIDVFSLWVRRGAPFQACNTLHRETTAEPAAKTWRLSTLLAPLAEPVLAIEVYDTRQIAANSRAVITAPRLTVDETPAALPLPPGAARRIAFDWTPGDQDPSAARNHVFRLVGAGDRTVTFVRFAETP